MINEIEHKSKPRNGKVIAGLILLVVGGVLLINQLNYFIFPYWLFSWPVFLIVWGLYIGSKHNFKKPSWLILVLIGSAFLLDRIFPGLNFNHIIWPVLIISLGIWMIVKRNHRWDRDRFRKDFGTKWDPQSNWRNYMSPEDPMANPTPAEEGATSSTFPPSDPSAFGPTGDDFIETTSIFGGVKKTVLSKNFKGGEIVNIFGGAEIDFSQADISGRVVIDITQLFGGIKLIVPPHWQVVSDLAAVFAGVDDKRMRTAASANSDKILVLKGTSIFAGVDIRSY